MKGVSKLVNTQSLFLFPVPQNVVLGSGQWLKPNQLFVRLSSSPLLEQGESKAMIKHRLLEITGKSCAVVDQNQEHEAAFSFIYNDQIAEQGYHLSIQETGVAIQYADLAGLSYALTTLKQIYNQCGAAIPYVKIEDVPDLKVRGLMLDIGRDKIPSMHSLYKLIDLMADLKMNHLQLYMEGYCFEYERYKSYFPDETPMTAAEFQALDQYASERFIDFVPNQNSLGHMAQWLDKRRFNELAECPDGFELAPGIEFPASTLNVKDPKSLELVENMLNELLPNFSSPFVNINFDEPFELGKGKSREADTETSIEDLYLEFLKKVVQIVQKHGKKPLLWGDIILKHPEMIKELPKDCVVLDWLYDKVASFESHCKMLKESGQPYIVCPGTSSWMSIAGRTDNMLANIADAAVNGKKYDASGLIVTDWGDMGHWQFAPISYAGYVYSAGLSWNAGSIAAAEADTMNYLNQFVFEDVKNVMGSFVFELGNYYQYENFPILNMTGTFILLSPMGGLSTSEVLNHKLNSLFESIVYMMANQPKDESIDFMRNYQYEEMRHFLDRMSSKLQESDMRCTDNHLIREELTLTIRLLQHGIDLFEFILLEQSEKEIWRREKLTGLIDSITAISDHYTQLWLQRNRIGGLDRSIQQFHSLKNQYEMKLKELMSI
jgi:hexosaminidase